MTGYVEVFKGEGTFQPWYYRLRSQNGQTLSVSEGYFSAWNARRAGRKVAESLGVPLKDLTRSKTYRKFP